MARSNTRAQISRLWKTATTTVPTNGASTTALDKRGFNAVGVVLFTLAASGAVTFKVSNDNSTYYTLEDPEGTSCGWAATTGSCALSCPSAVQPWPYVKLAYGATQTASGTQYWALQG